MEVGAGGWWCGSREGNPVGSGPAKHALKRVNFAGICVVDEGTMFRMITYCLVCCCCHLEILVICKQGALHFHLGLGSTNYVAVAIYRNVRFIECWLLVPAVLSDGNVPLYGSWFLL